MLHDGRFLIKLGFPSGTAFPTDPTPEESDVFYRTDLEQAFIYYGATWNEFGGGAVSASSVQVTLLNNSGFGLVSGDVVITGSTINESVVGTIQSGYCGKVLVAADTIAPDSTGLFWERGGPLNIRTVGAVSRNDGLRTSSTRFRAESAGGPCSGSVFAIALSPAVSGSVRGLFLDAEGVGGGNGDGGMDPADFTRWEPDASPIAPSAYDDEFDDLSLNVKWTEFDPGAFLTVSEGEAGLILDMVTDAGADWAGIYQAIPAGNFTIVARMSLMGIKADNAYAALLLWQDATDVSKGLYSLSVFYNSAAGMQIHLARWTNWQTWNSNLVILGTGNSTMYLRIRRTDTTYAFDVSSDGVGWYRLWSGALAFTPSYFGVGMNNENTGVTIRGVGHFFRYKDSDVGITGILEGDRVDGWRT